MEEKNVEVQETLIDFKRIMGIIKTRFWVIAICSVVCAVAAFIGSVCFITPKYCASSMYYLYNKSSYSGVTSNDIAAARNLVQTYSVILKTNSTLDDVLAEAGVNCTRDQLRNMITARSVNDTEILQIVVESDDPEEATQIAHAIEEVLPKRIDQYVLGTAIKVLDSAVTPNQQSSPDNIGNTTVGFVVGLFCSVCVLLILEIANVRIHSEEDIPQICGCPVLATVPFMKTSEKGSFSARKESRLTNWNKSESALIGPDISFAATEAYNRLHTMLDFSFADGKSAHVIGISSAICGEGKSTTSANLAYTLRQMNKKVILLDCDMRRPSVMNKLNIKRVPGMSNYLAGQCDFAPLIQRCVFSKKDIALDVVAAGRTPPNPIELLSSKRMHKLLNELREEYEYIILDLPPAGEVSDAVAVGKMTDGILLVVRQNFCNRYALADVTRQFNYVGTKLLGAIFNGTHELDKKYGYGYGNYGDDKNTKQRKYNGKFSAQQEKENEDTDF